MSTYFTSKLPATHAFGRGNRASLLNILRAHSLLSPAHKVVGPVPVCKEQCAALLCLDAATISVVALKQLSPDACISLCTMLGLSAMPVAPQAQADRIFKHVTDKRTADAAAAAGQQGGGGAQQQQQQQPQAAGGGPLPSRWGRRRRARTRRGWRWARVRRGRQWASTRRGWRWRCSRQQCDTSSSAGSIPYGPTFTDAGRHCCYSFCGRQWPVMRSMRTSLMWTPTQIRRFSVS